MTLPSVVVFGALLGGVYAVMAYGLGLIYGVMRIVNLAHGAVLMLAAYGAFSFSSATGLDPFLSLAILVPVGYAAGRFLYATLVRRVVRDSLRRVPGAGRAGQASSAAPMAAMLLLFGVGLCARNAAYLVWTGNDQVLTVPYGLATVWLGVPVPLTKVLIFGMSLAASAVLYGIVSFTHFGRALRAVVQDPDAAALSGLDVDRLSGQAFGLGTAIAAVGGMLLATVYVINPEFGSLFLLKSFCIIVLGGLESMGGILAGAITLGIVETAAGVYGSVALQDAVSFLLLVVILVVRPGGLPSLVKR